MLSDRQLRSDHDPFPIEMTVEEQFKSAVQIIQGLPKDGPFQVSHTMALKYYGLYKQATRGPCNIPKPAIWQVINRAKYEAWHALGDMAPTIAMRTYVEELKKIIETMSMTSDVASFTNLIGTFYEFVPEGEEEEVKVGGNVSDIARMVKGEALDENTSDSGIEAKGAESSELANALGRYVEESSVTEEEDGEDEEDLAAEGERLVSELTSLQREMRDMQQMRREISEQQPQELANGGVSRVPRSQWPETDENSDGDDDDDDLFEDPVGQDLSDGIPISVSTPTQGALKNAVTLLERDMEGIRERLSNLEKSQKSSVSIGTLWPCQELSGKTVMFVVSWPFVAHGIMSVLSSMRKK